MQKMIPRLLISAVGSGTGKTTVTAALLSAFCARGMRVQSLKCGPDYIDPMFHSHITGRPAYHADPFFLSRFAMRELVSRVSADADCTIFEGAMGYYDGIGGTEQASAYTVSDWLELPTLLVVNPQGMGCSIAAVCRGFQTFRTPNPICGILLNGVRRGMAAYYREILERETGLPVLGCLPQLSEVQLESRHLGLMTAGEVSRLDEKVRLLGKTAEETMQLDQILELARKAPPLPEVPLLSKPQPSFRLGIAQDRAFCFYYAENLELLEHYGAELVPFSPLEDAALPENLDGLYFGGGYPELYAKQLSENETMKESIRGQIDAGMPYLAECGGFMYLHETMEDMKKERWQMVGVLSGHAFYTGKLGRFGYVELTAQKAQILGEAGETIRAHEFHYFDSSENGDAFRAQKPRRKRGWDCMQASGTHAAGFPHLYYYSNPSFAANFVKACRKWEERT